jgi:hypothetical protein
MKNIAGNEVCAAAPLVGEGCQWHAAILRALRAPY